MGQAGPGDSVQRGWEARLMENVGAAGPAYTSRDRQGPRHLWWGDRGILWQRGGTPRLGTGCQAFPCCSGLVRDQARE